MFKSKNISTIELVIRVENLEMVLGKEGSGQIHASSHKSILSIGIKQN